MRSSAKPGKNFFEGHRSTFCIKIPFGIGHPQPTHQMQSTCVWEDSRVQNLQMEFNYLDSFKSYGIFSDFVVPMVPTLSPWSPRHPCCPHIVPMSSLSSPHHPHSPQKVTMWSPWLWSPWSLLSPWFPCCPCLPHIIPIIPTSSPHHLEGSHIISNPQIPTPPTPTPLRGGELRISKNGVRFELIEIF